MDVIKMARELGKLIQQDQRYDAYQSAKEKNDKDEELQRLIGDFNNKRLELNMEMSKTDKNDDRLKELDGVIKNLYGEIMVNPVWLNSIKRRTLWTVCWPKSIMLLLLALTEKILKLVRLSRAAVRAVVRHAEAVIKILK